MNYVHQSSLSIQQNKKKKATKKIKYASGKWSRTRANDDEIGAALRNELGRNNGLWGNPEKQINSSDKQISLEYEGRKRERWEGERGSPAWEARLGGGRKGGQPSPGKMLPTGDNQSRSHGLPSRKKIPARGLQNRRVLYILTTKSVKNVYL